VTPRTKAPGRGRAGTGSGAPPAHVGGQYRAGPAGSGPAAQRRRRRPVHAGRSPGGSADVADREREAPHRRRPAPDPMGAIIMLAPTVAGGVQRPPPGRAGPGTDALDRLHVEEPNMGRVGDRVDMPPPRAHQVQRAGRAQYPVALVDQRQVVGQVLQHVDGEDRVDRTGSEPPVPGTRPRTPRPGPRSAHEAAPTGPPSRPSRSGAPRHRRSPPAPPARVPGRRARGVPAPSAPDAGPAAPGAGRTAWSTPPARASVPPTPGRRS